MEPYSTMEWEINGHHIEWLANEHCVVLTKVYNITDNIVYVRAIHFKVLLNMIWIYLSKDIINYLHRQLSLYDM
ncbi:MAG: hypothetical protein ACLSBH_17490 [Coprobacillus cateniformis]